MPAKLKELQPKETAWTLQRLIVVVISLLMIPASVATAATPAPVNANAPASTPTAAPAVAAASAALTPLPPEVSVVPLKDSNGASFKLADFFGKVQVVNLWATWCGPCRREIPELIKLNKEFKSRGVEMIGLSTEDPNASAEKVRKFMQDFQIDYRIGWAPGEVALK
jgi:thiol-disulfide isomerase/thioredoxin